MSNEAMKIYINCNDIVIFYHRIEQQLLDHNHFFPSWQLWFRNSLLSIQKPITISPLRLQKIPLPSIMSLSNSPQYISPFVSFMYPFPCFESFLKWPSQQSHRLPNQEKSLQLNSSAKVIGSELQTRPCPLNQSFYQCPSQAIFPFSQQSRPKPSILSFFHSPSQCPPSLKQRLPWPLRSLFHLQPSYLPLSGISSLVNYSFMPLVYSLRWMERWENSDRMPSFFLRKSMLEGWKDFEPILSALLMSPMTLLSYLVLVEGRWFKKGLEGNGVEKGFGEAMAFQGVIAEDAKGLLLTIFLWLGGKQMGVMGSARSFIFSYFCCFSLWVRLLFLLRSTYCWYGDSFSSSRLMVYCGQFLKLVKRLTLAISPWNWGVETCYWSMTTSVYLCENTSLGASFEFLTMMLQTSGIQQVKIGQQLFFFVFSISARFASIIMKGLDLKGFDICFYLFSLRQYQPEVTFMESILFERQYRLQGCSALVGGRGQLIFGGRGGEEWMTWIGVYI